MNILRTMLLSLSVCVLASCHPARPPALPDTPQTAGITPPSPALWSEVQSAPSCGHFQYRNPVVDRVEITGGLYGGVYTPTH